MSLTFAVGDIHGCYRALVRMLARIKSYASSGKVVFLGDYIDRGPDSRRVLRHLMHGPQTPGWDWIALKGNHEDMMVGALSGRSDETFWLGNGGLQTLRSYRSQIPRDDIDWADGLPLVHVDEHRIFVHAGVRMETYLDQQTTRDFLWSRVPPDFSGEYWGKHLVHGHTQVQGRKPVTIGNRTNIDTGCVFNGILSCAVFDDDSPGGPLDFIQVSGQRLAI